MNDELAFDIAVSLNKIAVQLRLANVIAAYSEGGLTYDAKQLGYPDADAVMSDLRITLHS